MTDLLNSNLQQIGTWKRVFFMLIFTMIAGLVRILLWVVILIQLGTVIFTGDVNQHILNFGRSLAAYMYHMLLFLTFNTDDLAFPFASWSLTKTPDDIKSRS
ncbi:MAG: DUF4389 domain-containing protein [Methylococcales bacterium]|nr:DUF4389 domain-containing protein [Methylococcales bacterium]